MTWRSGTDGIDADYTKRFAEWRGRPTTSNWINAHYQEWSWLTAPGLLTTLDGKNPVKAWDLLKDRPGISVLSMSMAGSDELKQPAYDDALRSCAAGELDDEWQAFAANAKAAGRTGDNTVVSLAHEFNGTWFPWNPKTVGLERWLACWRNIYVAIKSASDIRVAWVFSATDHTEVSGDYAVASAWDAYPGDAFVDVIGVNRYDFKMLSRRTIRDWHETCENKQDICYAAQYAREHKKALGVPEWSVERGEYGYGDNPNFVTMMYKFFADNADILAFENNFNNGGDGKWHLYPEAAFNAESARRYQQLWRKR